MSTTNRLTLLLLFFFSISFCQPPKDTIYGKVKSVREQLNFVDKEHQNLKLFPSEGDYGHYGFSDPKFTISRFHNLWYNTPWVHYSNYYKEFNENGKATLEIWFYKDGDTIETSEYNYDKEDKLVQVKEIYKIRHQFFTNYTYDHKNKLVSSIFYIPTNPNRYRYTYYDRDSLSNLLEEKKFDENGQGSSYKYSYDNLNRVVSKSVHNPDVYVNNGTTITSIRDDIGIDKLYEKYIYDDNSNIIETISYNANSYDNLSSIYSGTIKNEYENGLLKKAIYISDSIDMVLDYKYDNRRKKVKETITVVKDPEFNRSSEYVYDKAGNIVKLIYTENKKSVIVKFEYEFDKQNNWTKQIKSLDGKKLFVWTREISYYN